MEKNATPNWSMSDAERARHLNNNIPRHLKAKFLLAASLLFMASCSNEEAEATFPRPNAAEYFLNAEDGYYDHLRAVREETTHPTAVTNIDRLLETPIAQWLNTDTDSSQKLILENISRSVPQGEIPLFVAYNIPNRDLGGEARGGLATASEYESWIDAISDAVGDASAVMILEPDALAAAPQMDTDVQRNERFMLLRYAATKFHENNENMAVYLDAGNSGWLSVESASGMINEVDPSGRLIGGIALNVSNRYSDQETKIYGDNIMRNLNRHLRVMIDTSRNGSVNTDELTGWCNVEGEHVGSSDAFYDPNEIYEEAFIKVPGESDGVCGTSAKVAGEFDKELLLKQVS